MSVRYLLVAYAVTLALFVVGCSLIERSKIGLTGARWLKAAFSIACAGVVLALFRPFLPPLLSVDLPHLAIFTALVLFHQAINDVLEFDRRYLPFSFALGAGAVIGLVTFTVISPNVDMRIYIMDTAEALQAGVTAVTLFRFKDGSLRFPVLNAGCVLAGIALTHAARILFTLLYPAQAVTNLSLAGPGQVLLTFFNFILGIGAGFSLIWLSVYGHRNTLETLAHSDGLTGLMNRRGLEDLLRRELGAAQSQGRLTALALVDLDFFKDINDEFGHLVGDEIIRVVAKILQEIARSSNAVARFGGDEFLVVLRDSNATEASVVAELIRDRLESTGAWLPGIHVTASVGVAISSPGDTTYSLLKKADEALYSSKRSGRNIATMHSVRPRLPRLGHKPRTLWHRARTRSNR